MTQEDGSQSVTQHIAGLKLGDSLAAYELWQRYYQRLVDLARVRLRSTPRRVSDEEDVALSVFNSLCRSAEAGRLELLADRDELWKMLVAITHHKVVDQIRHQNRAKRGGAAVSGESFWQAAGQDGDIRGIEQVPADVPTAEILCQIVEERTRLLQLLPNDSLRDVAMGKLDSLTNDEIADKLGLSTRSIERKLNLIRECWGKEFAETTRGTRETGERS